ncbi:MAG: hypothetical protein Q8934_19270 [Bacillota bacterium]|nr:hypothetical protein [Bacillota bacterium]
MREFKWSDKQVEDILKQMPVIKDYRNPEEIYQSLSTRSKKRKHLTWILPSFASTAVVVIIFILAFNYQNWLHQPIYHSAEQKSLALVKNTPSNLHLVNNETKFDSIKKIVPKNFNRRTVTSLKTAIYKENIKNGNVFTYWIPDIHGQILVPISIIVNNPGNQSPWLNLYNQEMNKLKEAEWGLSDFYPLKATLKYDHQDNSVIVDVPANHKYGQGADSESTFTSVLERNLSSNSNIKKIKLTTNGKPGIMFGNFGLLKELDVKGEQNHSYFLFFPAGKVTPFLVPSNESFNDIKSAFESMRKNRPILGLKASIPHDLIFKFTSIKNKTLFLTVQSSPNLVNNPVNVYTYEAILLTAKEFGLENVKLKNLPFKQLGPFDLTKANEVPVAPNFCNIENQP